MPRDSTVASKLRDAGVVLLGKTTMSQWAECRSKDAAKGWSAYGGQGSAAYSPMQDPSGSSSGSGIAASIGMALAALGTEVRPLIHSNLGQDTDRAPKTGGSIILPSSASNLVGIKPTVGLTSRSLVIPFSHRQDTVGPMARTVKDAAYILSAIAGKDPYDNYTSAQPFPVPPSYVNACKRSGLKGARIGIPRNGYAGFMDNTTLAVERAFNSTISVFQSAGATIVDNANFGIFDIDMIMGNSSIVLDTDLVSNLAEYLSLLTGNPHNVHDLQDIMKCTRADPREGYPDPDTLIWDRALARNLTNISPEAWSAYQSDLFLGGEGGVLGALAKYELDALIMPSFASYLLPGLAGLPVITMPLGSYPSNTPIGKSAKGNLIKTAPNIPCVSLILILRNTC